METFSDVIDVISSTRGDLQSEFRSAVLPVTVFVCVEIGLGLLGNGVVLFGFATRYPRCTYRSLILTLAFVDMLSCLTTMPGEVYTQMNLFEFSSVVLCKAKSFVNVFTLSLEILVLLIFAVDRYKQTCTPHAVQMTSGFVMYLFAVCFITVACLSIPASIGFGKHEYFYVHRGQNVSVVTCALCDVYVHNHFNLIYSICLQSTACLSLVVMFVVYVSILRNIYCRPRNVEMENENSPLLDRELNQEEERHVKVRSVQMFTVSMVFILTSLTCRGLGFIINNHETGFSIHDSVIITFFYRLYFVNHVIHPVIYGICDLKFRHIVKALCFRRA